MIFLFWFSSRKFILRSLCSGCATNPYTHILHAHRIHFTFWLCLICFLSLSCSVVTPVAASSAIRLTRFIMVFGRVSPCHNRSARRFLLFFAHCVWVPSISNGWLVFHCAFSWLLCTREFITWYWVIFNYLGTYQQQCGTVSHNIKWILTAVHTIGTTFAYMPRA